MDGVDTSVMMWYSTTLGISHMYPSLMCVRSSHPCIKVCVLLHGQQVIWYWDVLPTWGIVQKALGKRNGFGDDVIAQQPSHPCLVVHSTVCHVAPYIFYSQSNSWASGSEPADSILAIQSLQRERWGLLCYDLKPGHVE